MPIIDQNTKNVGLGLVQGTTDFILPFNINSLNELLIEVIPCGILSSLVPNRMLIDENTKNTSGVVTNDSDEIIRPVTCDVIINLPCVRIEIL